MLLPSDRILPFSGMRMDGTVQRSSRSQSPKQSESQAEPLRATHDPTSYRANGSTPRTSIHQSSRKRSTEQTEDSTSFEEFFDDDEDERGDRRPFLQVRSLSTTSSKRGRPSRSNSFKMKQAPGSHKGDTPPMASRESFRQSNGETSKAPSELTLDDLFDPTKTLQENKSMMISAEFDRMGMGRYQICIWFLCGCGYFSKSMK